MFSNSQQFICKFFKANTDEIKFFWLFILAVIVNKYVLSELQFTVPTVFQGWQTFTCVILLSVLMKFQKVSSELKMLDKRSLFMTVPAFACFAFSIVAGSKSLSALPVPVFCAILSLHPAILALADSKIDFSETSKRICGSVTICGTVVIILTMSLNKRNVQHYLWLLSHILFSAVYTLYMKRINLDISVTSEIYYRNFFSVVVLLPLSIYLDVLRLPRHFNWEFYLGCILSGVLGTFLQIITARVEVKSSYTKFQGCSKLACSLLAHNLFFANIEPIIWFVVMLNLLINAFALSPDAEETECEKKKKKLTFIVGPPHGRDVNMENIISV